ncbi:MAG: radical SAM protein [Elusimicrobiota bacterium]
MKILLVKPRWFVSGGVYRYLEKIKFTPLHLGILAALTPAEHEVRVVDGDWEEIPDRPEADLVGITTTTFTSGQVFEIADRYRSYGAKVVLGGVHPCLMPEESLQHCDAIVVGEAEYIWKDVISDVQNGTLKKVYRSGRVTEMKDVPFPRRGLLNESSWFACIQTSRGCPNSCRYCYLPSVPWHAHRYRSVESVYNELKSIHQSVIFFVDDNIFADHGYVKELCNAIKPLHKLWSVQTPTSVAKDEETVAAMAAAGCFNVQIGFQTINPDSLQWATIKQNKVGEYKNIVEVFHKYNILVTAFLIFGFDTDTKNIFDATIKMVQELDIDDANLYILTPYPGTELYDKFKSEGRLIESKGKDRTHYGWNHAVFQPKNMTAEELEKGVQYAADQLYGYFKKKVPIAVIKRLPQLIRRPSLIATLFRGGFGKMKITKELKY